MKALPVIFIFVICALLILTPNVDAKHIIKAYFNGQEATVTGVRLKVGEPFTVDFNVTPDRYTTVAALLREPGGDDDAYRLISGDPEGVVVRKMGGPDSTVNFHWVLAPSEGWTGGTAPLNLQYDVWGETMNGDIQGYFTVVEAYISPEHYQPPKQAGDGPLMTVVSCGAAFLIASCMATRKD